jgi:hypothetical protein
MAKRIDIIHNKEDFMQKAYDKSWELMDAQMDIIMDEDMDPADRDEARARARGMADVMALYTPSATVENIPRDAYTRWEARQDG